MGDDAVSASAGIRRQDPAEHVEPRHRRTAAAEAYVIGALRGPLYPSRVRKIRKGGCGGRIRTDDLRVMSPPSFHCSTPLSEDTARGIASSTRTGVSGASASAWESVLA